MYWDGWPLERILILFISLAFMMIGMLNVVFQIMMWLGVVSGMIGSYFHVRGVGIRVGGWVLRNFLIGPPVTLPMMFTAMSVLGLIAIYWRG